MGLVLKTKTEKPPNLNDNYKARYVELAKPMAGSVALIAYYLLGGVSDDSDMKIKLSNIFANFICWLLGEEIIHRLCVYYNLYTKANSKNPLYRNLKTLSSLGFSIGLIVASLSTSLINQKWSIFLCSMLMSSVIGLFAFIMQKFGNDFFLQNDAQLGTEGWSKYAKTALVLGASLGQLLGGIVSYIQKSDLVKSMKNITIYGAIASVISFFAIVICVPLINYFTRDKNGKGILVTANRNIFNNNYVRSGLLLGLAIGTIFGGFLGPLIVAGLSVEIAIVIFASAFSIIFGIGLGFYGQKISAYFERCWGVSSNTENSWSYATRSSSYFFSYIGIVVAYAICPATVLIQAVAIGSAIASLVGWFAGLLTMWLARKVEPDETKVKAVTLPWTQRMSSGVTRGVIIGAVVGLALSFLIGGPLGLGGWCVLISALGGIIGGIKCTVSEPVFSQLAGKATSLFFDTAASKKTGMPGVMQPLNRHSFFSCNLRGSSESQAFNHSTDMSLSIN